MLTNEALEDEFWGPLKELRHTLEGKEVPDRYSGSSSVSDNVFDAVGRHLELSVLVREHAEVLAQAARSKSDAVQPIVAELKELVSILHGECRRFSEEAEEHQRTIGKLLDEYHSRREP